MTKKYLQGRFAYHQWPVAQVAKHFDVDLKTGLSEEKVLFRIKRDGPNSLEKLKEISPFSIFFHQFANFFIGLLFVAALISYFVDGLYQALVLLIIIAVNVSLGFFQEYKAERALADLKSNFKIKAKAYRNGKIEVINSEDLVAGDLVIVEAGDRVPADLRLVEEESLRANESALTGESLPISKQTKVLPLDTPMADRRNIIFAGSNIAAGRGTGIVVSTGQATEFGRIASLIEKPEEPTPLERQIGYLGKVLIVISIVAAAIIFLLGYIRGLEIWPLLTYAIAVMVAAVPESLPTAVTLALAVGVSRMAAKKAIVRRMAVIETLGTTNIIATDKTGTLTDNNLTVDRVVLYEKGKFVNYTFNGNHKYPPAADFLTHGLAASNLNLAEEGKYLGDPVEVAIIERADEQDKLVRFKAKGYKRLMEIPFDSDKKYMAVMVQSEGQKSLIVKGMPEKIVDFCILTKEEKKKILAKADELSIYGYKVIALASKHLGGLSSSALARMSFQGFFAIVDEPSEGIKQAIKNVMSAGIRPIIITGDHPETAKFVAGKIGLQVQDDEIIVGTEFEKLNKKELLQLLSKVKIFARVTPEDKIRIVTTLQEAGFSVAMAGDGVNDAPALREAGVGIAMGMKGTDAAKDSADIVLSDDKYSTIVSAVEYGRAIFDNLKNVVAFLVAGNLNEVLLIAVAFLFGLPLPLTTLQILWANMITDSVPALAMSLEKPSPHVLREAPRSMSKDSLRSTLLYSLYLSVVSFVLCLAVYLFGLNQSVTKAQTLTFVFFAFIQFAYAFSIRSKKRIWESVSSFFHNQLLIAALLGSVIIQMGLFFEPFASIFHLEALNFGEMIFLGIMVAVAFIAAEIIRYFHDKKTKNG